MSGTGSQQRETSRDRQRRETRRALLEAAYQAFCEVGYAEASLERIAGGAGFTKGALYGHFAGKEELFLALIERETAAVLRSWQQAAPDDVSREALPRSLGDWLATTLRENRAWALANLEFAVLAVRKPELSHRLSEGIRAAATGLSAVTDRLFGEHASAGHVVLTLVHGLIVQSALDPDLDVAANFTHALSLLAARGTEPAE